MSGKIKKVARQNLPHDVSLLSPFIVYTIVSYWQLPVWVFAVYMTLWAIGLVAKIWLYTKTEYVDIFKE